MNGDLYLVTGMSRAGKTRWVETQIADADRLVVWDPKNEWGRVVVGEHTTDVQSIPIQVRAMARGKLRYVPGANLQREFQIVSQAVLAIAALHGPVVFVAEELADVCPPGKAVGSWGTVMRQGRGRQITTYGITQAPAESDKTIIRNANVIHCCKLGREADRRYMEKELDIAPGALDRLTVSDTFGDFVEKREGGEPITGRLTFKTGKIKTLTP